MKLDRPSRLCHRQLQGPLRNRWCFNQGRSHAANTKTCQVSPISNTILFTRYTHTGKGLFLSQGGENLNNLKKAHHSIEKLLSILFMLSSYSTCVVSGGRGRNTPLEAEQGMRTECEWPSELQRKFLHTENTFKPPSLKGFITNYTIFCFWIIF